jgi:site-specific DNA-cytosine methylase
MPLVIDLFCGLGGWTEGLLAAAGTRKRLALSKTSSERP